MINNYNEYAELFRMIEYTQWKYIVLNTTDPWDAYSWAQKIGDKEEMKPIVFNSNKEDIINSWKKYIK